MLTRLLGLLLAWWSRLRQVVAKLWQGWRGSWIESESESTEGRLGFAPWAPRARPYRLYRPPDRETGGPRPLWVWLHGCRQTPQSFALGTRIESAAQEAGAFVLMPRQLRRANPWRCWNWFDRANLRGHGEAAIVMAMIDEVCAQYPIDPDRICVAGLSAGAALSCILASLFPQRFRAVAMHSGVSYAAAQSALTARAAIAHGSGLSGEASAAMARMHAASHRAVPALVMHGSADLAVPVLHLEQVEAHFRAFNARSDDEAPRLERVLRREGGLDCRIDTWFQGNRLLVQSVRIEGLGHAWSGGDARAEYHDARGPEATRLIIEFFRDGSSA
jgi:poly(hydroxyalkanoate) depolymerase family esterase